jgi:hypothetical protein
MSQQVLQGDDSDVNGCMEPLHAGVMLDDKTVSMWGAATGTLMHTLEDHTRDVESVASVAES